MTLRPYEKIIEEFYIHGKYYGFAESAPLPQVPESFLFFCPVCHSVYAKRVSYSENSKIQGDWYLVDRACFAHGGGSIIVEHLEDDSSVIYFPREVIERELGIAALKEERKSGN